MRHTLSLVIVLVLLGVGVVLFRDFLLDTVRGIVQPQIQVESLVDNLDMRDVKKELIKEALDRVAFFDPGQVTYYTPSTAQRERVSARKVKVAWTDLKQPLGLAFYEGESEPFQSWGVEYAPTDGSGEYDIVIKLYLRDDIVRDKSSEELGEWYQGLLLRAVWDLTHPQRPEYEGMERFEGMDEFVQDSVKEAWWEIAKGGQK